MKKKVPLLLAQALIVLVGLVVFQGTVYAGFMCCDANPDGSASPNNCGACGTQIQGSGCSGSCGCGRANTSCCLPGECGTTPPTPACMGSNPESFSLTSPANETKLPADSVTLLWSNTTGWGNGCPNNNQFKLFLSLPGTLNCNAPSATYSQRGTYSEAGASAYLSGLVWGSRYCWYIEKSNGANSITSERRAFVTNSLPTLTYRGQIAADVCGTGTSGRAGSAGVTNPAKFKIDMSDIDADPTATIQLAFLPRSGGYLSNISESVLNFALTSTNSFRFGLSYSGSAYNAFSYDPATATWQSTLSGDLQANNGRGTLLEVGDVSNGTNSTVASNLTEAIFKIRFENGFGQGVTNPTGIWDIYALGVTLNSDNQYYTSDASGRWSRIGDWKVDLTPPNALITAPIYNSDGSFSMAFTASDAVDLINLEDFITSPSLNAALRDNSVGSNITFASPPSQETSPANGFAINYRGSPVKTFNLSKTYIDQSIEKGVDYNYKLVALDIGCNQAIASVTASIPIPWILTYSGNASVNDDILIATSQSEIKILDIPGMTLSGLPGLNYNNGANGPFLSTYSSMSGTSRNLAKPSNNISLLNRYVSSYVNESANPPEGVSWYDYLFDLVSKNTTVIERNVSSSQGNTGNSNIPTASAISRDVTGWLSIGLIIPPDVKTNVRIVGGNVWLNRVANLPNFGMTCNTKSIIFIEGDLLISPDFKISGDNGCLFVVKGKVVIDDGGQRSAVIPVGSDAQPYYDILETSIVSDRNIEIGNDARGSTEKGEGIYIRGSMVSQANILLKRDLNLIANGKHPAEIIFNDPLYTSLFKDDLKVRKYSIRELLNWDLEDVIF